MTCSNLQHLKVCVSSSLMCLWCPRTDRSLSTIDVFGFYEVSALHRVNVEETFFDAARLGKAQKAMKNASVARRELDKLSGINGKLPWNWGRKARYVHLSYVTICEGDR